MAGTSSAGGEHDPTLGLSTIEEEETKQASSPHAGGAESESEDEACLPTRATWTCLICNTGRPKRRCISVIDDAPITLKCCDREICRGCLRQWSKDQQGNRTCPFGGHDVDPTDEAAACVTDADWSKHEQLRLWNEGGRRGLCCARPGCHGILKVPEPGQLADPEKITCDVDGCGADYCARCRMPWSAQEGEDDHVCEDLLEGAPARAAAKRLAKRRELVAAVAAARDALAAFDKRARRASGRPAARGRPLARGAIQKCPSCGEAARRAAAGRTWCAAVAASTGAFPADARSPARAARTDERGLEAMDMARTRRLPVWPFRQMSQERVPWTFGFCPLVMQQIL